MKVQLFGSFIILFFLSGISNIELQPGHGKALQDQQPPSPFSRAKTNPSVIVSGDLTTKGGHRCSWQTSGNGLVSLLLVNCTSQTAGQQQSYWCRYSGQTNLCPVYGVKLIQYWKQLVRKLKKRQNACKGEKVLRVKTCKVNTKAHLKLTHRSDEEMGKSKKYRPQSGGKVKAEEEKMAVMTMNKSEERVQKDLEPVQTYCSQGWSTICTFFLTFLQGPGSI